MGTALVEEQFPVKITEATVGVFRAYKDGTSFVLVDDEGSEYWFTEKNLRNVIVAANWALETL